MVKELDGPKEPASKRAERRWRNHSISERFKKMKETGVGEDDFLFYDGKKPIGAEVPKPPHEPPQPADVVENDRPRVSTLERKFKQDIRAMLNGHAKVNIQLYAAAIRHQKRSLMLEKIRRLEASIAQLREP